MATEPVLALLSAPDLLVGVFLLAVAAALLTAEAIAPGFGAFAAAAAAVTAVAGVLLFDGPTAIAVTILLVLVIGGAGASIGVIAARMRGAPEVVGAAGTLVGAVGVVKDANGWTGQALVEGARWQVVATVPLHPGMRVRVVSLDGLVASVQPVTPPVRT